MSEHGSTMTREFMAPLAVAFWMGTRAAQGRVAIEVFGEPPDGLRKTWRMEMLVERLDTPWTGAFALLSEGQVAQPLLVVALLDESLLVGRALLHGYSREPWKSNLWNVYLEGHGPLIHRPLTDIAEEMLR
jgi:hypothetical protein